MHHIVSAPYRKNFITANMWTHILLVAVAVATIQATDYCDISAQHQLCNPAGKPASACTNTVSGDYKRSVTEEDQKIIVDMHNKLRRDLANGKAGTMPKAANMEKFTWDEELARIAQAQVNKCVYGHDCKECKKDKDGCYNGVGQNIAYRSWSRLVNQSDWHLPIQAWYDEIKDYDNAAKDVESLSTSGSTGVVLHFTQIIWAETYKVGCGFIIYFDGQYYKRLYSCNYGHGGNWIGRPIYLKGEPCSKCPKDTKCEDSLCAYV